MILVLFVVNTPDLHFGEDPAQCHQKTDDSRDHPHDTEWRLLFNAVADTSLGSGQLAAEQETQAPPRGQSARQERGNIQETAEPEAPAGQDEAQ